MKYLIDTHVLIWFLEGSVEIPEKTRLISKDEVFKGYSITRIW